MANFPSRPPFTETNLQDNPALFVANLNAFRDDLENAFKELNEELEAIRERLDLLENP